MTESEICPVCSGEMMSLDIPDKNLFHCTECGELGQLLQSGTVSRLDPLLEKNRLGDDRVRAAISQPHVASAEGFVDIVENLKRGFEMDMAQASGGLRTILAQVGNRINVGIKYLADASFTDDNAALALVALEEARDLVSQGPKATRGIDDGSSSTHSAEG